MRSGTTKIAPHILASQILACVRSLAPESNLLSEEISLSLKKMEMTNTAKCVDCMVMYTKIPSTVTVLVENSKNLIDFT